MGLLLLLYLYYFIKSEIFFVLLELPRMFWISYAEKFILIYANLLLDKFFYSNTTNIIDISL